MCFVERTSSAKIIRTTYSKVDLKEIINTNLFDFSTAASGAGWLASLRESTLMEMTMQNGEKRMVPKPETLEYGIGSFVYSSRRPFHPRRLWDLLSAPFCVMQDSYDDDEDDDEDEDGGEDTGADEEQDVEMDEETRKANALEEMEKTKAELDLPSRAKAKRESPVWKGLLRSKGFIWMATRPHVHGEWSQAGVGCRFLLLLPPSPSRLLFVPSLEQRTSSATRADRQIMFTLNGGGPWMCRVPEDEWPGGGDQEVIDAIKLDFMGEWGDRRQERKVILSSSFQLFLPLYVSSTSAADTDWASGVHRARSGPGAAHKHAQFGPLDG
jgi:G3E family GTPase